MRRIIFHIDVNSAFLSWEAVRRLKNGDVDIRKIPSCIGGDPNSRKGVVLAKSIPAKKYNIRTGEPLSLTIKKCPSIRIVPPDFRLYSQCSKAFKDICKRYSPIIEEFSIDECFLDVTSECKTYRETMELAYELKDKIKNELGFTVNVGIGFNKLCAKMASDFEKPDKVHTLFPKEIPAKMWKMKVENLLYVGNATAQKLNSLHIYTIGKLAHADPKYIAKFMGTKKAYLLHEYANGIDNSEVNAIGREPKGYSNSITLEENVTSLDTANTILLSLAESISEHMRSDGFKAYSIGVTIRYSNFKKKSHQRSLLNAIDTTNSVYENSKSLLGEMWADRSPIRLIGIMLNKLTKMETGEQISFFNMPQVQKNVKNEKLDKTIDNLRRKFGSGIIKRGAIMTSGLDVAKKFKGKMDSEH